MKLLASIAVILTSAEIHMGLTSRLGYNFLNQPRFSSSHFVTALRGLPIPTHQSFHHYHKQGQLKLLSTSSSVRYLFDSSLCSTVQRKAALKTVGKVHQSSQKYLSLDMIRTTLDEFGPQGELKRRPAAWRNWIRKESDSQFPAAGNGRYHLYVSYACPWAHRTLMVRTLKGLEDAIGVTVVHPTWQKTKPDDPNDHHTGWIFGNPASSETYTNSAGNGGPFPAAFKDNSLDPFDENAKTIRDVYERCGDVDGKYSVPVLYDTLAKTIVSNESSEIIRMLNSEMNEFAKYPKTDLYPTHLQPVIDEINDWVYATMNNGVYRCGFTKSQIAYDEAIKELTATFDRIDQILQRQRYLTGNDFTEADVRLFVTLIRFDEVYIVYFKTNTRSVQHTPAILNYLREIYQMSGIASTVSMEHIKTHYFTSHPQLNFYSIIPAGSNFIELLAQPHNRDELFPSVPT